MVFLLGYRVSGFSVAVINHHEQRQLKEETVHFGHRFQRQEPITLGSKGQARWQEPEAVKSRPQLQIGSREGKLVESQG